MLHFLLAPALVLTPGLTPLPAVQKGKAVSISSSSLGGLIVIEEAVEIGDVDPAMLAAMAQDGAVPPPPGAESGEEGEKKEEKKIDQELLKKLQSATYDRRPSVRLAIWSKPEPKDPEEDEELAFPEEPPSEDTLIKPVQPKKWMGKAPATPWGFARYHAWKAKLDPLYEPAKEAYEAAKKELKEKKKEYEKKKKEIEKKRLERKAEIFQRHVTLGRWDELAPYFDAIGEEGTKKVYQKMLTTLAKTPSQGSSNLRKHWEQHTFSFDDVLELMDMGPDEFKAEDYMRMTPILRLSLGQGHDLEEGLQSFRDEIDKPEEERRLTKREAALLLSNQGLNVEMGEFLPSLEEAVTADDREALNLLARHHVAKSNKEADFDLLEDAWNATLAALAPGEIEDVQKTEALKRAVTLAPKLQSTKGDEWLIEAFSSRPDRGMEIIATIGRDVSTGMVENNYNPDRRLKAIKLMRSTIEALLEKAPERAEAWQDSLNLLADCWLREAKHSYEYAKSDESGPGYRRDPYGNIYWTSYDRSYRSNPVKVLAPAELLEIRPDGRWRELLYQSVSPKFDTTVAELFLKVREEKQAFPYIEALAKTNPNKANELAKEFLNVWIQNNDPNSSRNRADIYSYSFGYYNRATGIPLTRSKQERNLRDLSKWVHKLKSVEGIELDSGLLMKAFTGSHSYAEVYRIETMEEVFGSLEDLDPKTLASMAGTMRANLAGLWRRADVQNNAKTNRKKKDIQAEVERGYGMAQLVLARALKAHPGHWRLQVARAAMMHDLNNYQNDIQKSSSFAGKRQGSLDLFAEAAENYVDTLGDLRREDYSIEPFIRWFYASLGASDVDAITPETVLAQNEIRRIRKALEEIPGEDAEIHLAMFANRLFTHLGEVNAAVKNRYLEAGFDIVGDHPQARAARKVYDYYADLVTEIELHTIVEGDSNVGTGPFGVMVEIHYTKEIERESGGFSKYLQNQSNNVNYYYNYGRPQEDYRDKFEEAARTILSEQFTVHSVTFNKEDVKSKSSDRDGWRRLPYAYFLLEAKGPEVDRIPPLKIDLDFNDVTGYVVLPIAAPVVPIDASVQGVQRPYEDLQITQTLDERKADEGILSLEIKVQANGLVPDRESIMELAPPDFEVVEDKDQGVSVARFSDDEEGILSERIWIVDLKAKEGVKEAQDFRFAEPRDSSVQSVYQRYDDADLVTAKIDVDLLAKYGEEGGFPWLWLLSGVGLLALGFVGFRAMGGLPEEAQAEVIAIPKELTPFNVIGLLRQVREADGITERQRDEIDDTVTRIERFYFDEESRGERPDLPRIAQEWASRA